MTRKAPPGAALVERLCGLALLVVLVTLLFIWRGAHGDDTGVLQALWPATDFSRRTVALDEIISGGPPKDGIPAIDAPGFVDFAKADAWLHPKEPVITLAIGETARAYPLQILMYHEIVNDILAGVPVSVTFCPLCNAAIVFDRRADGGVHFAFAWLAFQPDSEIFTDGRPR